MPQLTGYGYEDDMPMQPGQPMPAAPAMDPTTQAPMETETARQEPSNPGAEVSGGGRTGADVIAACMNAPTVRPGGAGTTAPQGEMEYGADPGYGM
jgi:hypothetical protein